MKNLTWKIEWRDGGLTLTKNGAAFARFVSDPCRKMAELTDLRNLLNAQEVR